MSRTICPNALFRYADKFAKRNEAAGKGTVYPTLRQAASRFRCRLDDIENACESYIGEGYLGVACGIGIQGVGAALIEHRSNWLVEAYK